MPVGGKNKAVDINARNSISNSGSNKTTQNVLALIVYFDGIFPVLFIRFG